jgi:hypothetical protein
VCVRWRKRNRRAAAAVAICSVFVASVQEKLLGLGLGICISLYVCVYCCVFPFWTQKAASEQVLFVLKLLGSFGARQLSLLSLLQLMCSMFVTGFRLFLCPL